MTSLSPDLMTASGMTALAAFVAAWLLWLRGRLHWQKGVPQAVVAAILIGAGYLLFAIQARVPLVQLHAATQLLVSAGIAGYTLALLRFRQRSGRLREVLVFMLPVLGSAVLVLGLLPQHPAHYNRLQSLVNLLQMTYLLLQLLRMRGSTPGVGWKVVTAACCIQSLAIVPTMISGQRQTPLLVGSTSLWAALAMWLVCIVLFLNMIVISVGFLMMLRDRQAVLEKHRAGLDPLTELCNRLTMVEGLQQAIDASSLRRQPLALLMVDIDHFKHLNDDHGHLVGDQAIQMVARVLGEHARSTDQVARYGGEEFVLVLPDTPQDQASAIAQRLCAAIRSTPLSLRDGQHLNLTASIGVHVCVPDPGVRWQELVDAADAAMYAAKHEGRDRVALSGT